MNIEQHTRRTTILFMGPHSGLLLHCGFGLWQQQQQCYSPIGACMPKVPITTRWIRKNPTIHLRRHHRHRVSEASLNYTGGHSSIFTGIKTFLPNPLLIFHNTGHCIPFLHTTGSHRSGLYRIRTHFYLHVTINFNPRAQHFSYCSSLHRKSSSTTPRLTRSSLTFQSLLSVCLPSSHKHRAGYPESSTPLPPESFRSLSSSTFSFCGHTPKKKQPTNKWTDGRFDNRLEQTSSGLPVLHLLLLYSGLLNLFTANSRR